MATLEDAVRSGSVSAPVQGLKARGLVELRELGADVPQAVFFDGRVLLDASPTSVGALVEAGLDEIERGAGRRALSTGDPPPTVALRCGDKGDRALPDQAIELEGQGFVAVDPKAGLPIVRPGGRIVPWLRHAGISRRDEVRLERPRALWSSDSMSVIADISEARYGLVVADHRERSMYGIDRLRAPAGLGLGADATELHSPRWIDRGGRGALVVCDHEAHRLIEITPARASGLP